MSTAQEAGVYCPACQQTLPPFTLARAPFVYDFPVDAALKAIKFKRQLHYVSAFASILLRTLERDFSAADALLPVPLHRWRHAKRGFNQATELCNFLQRDTGLQVLRNVRRNRATKPQTGLNAVERRRNLKRAFSVEGDVSERNILIVDDVITTGETCKALATALLNAGAADVGVLTVARAYPGATGANV